MRNELVQLMILKKLKRLKSIYQILIVSSKNDFEFFTVVRQKIKKLFYFIIIIILITSNLCLLFFMTKKFCFICFQPYQNDFFHKCIKICKFCERKTCKEEVIKKCNNCNTNCLNNLCL